MALSWLIGAVALFVLLHLIEFADRCYALYQFRRRVQAARQIVERQISAPALVRNTNFRYGTAEFAIDVDAANIAALVPMIRGALVRPVLLTWDAHRVAYLTVFLYREGL